MELNGCIWCETILTIPVPRNTAFRTDTQVLHLLTCGRFTKCSKPLPNIILGLMELNGWICCEIIFTTSVPRNSALRPETEVSCQFTFRRIPKCSKHSQTWLLVQGIGMKAFGGKWFSQFRYTEIVHSRTKHKFCIFSHEECWRMFQNTCKSHFGSKAVLWMHLVWKHFPNFGTQNSAFTPETKVFCIFYFAKVFEMLEKNPNHHFLSNGVECMQFVRNHFCKIGALE
jgi:hypothetical protein